MSTVVRNGKNEYTRCGWCGEIKPEYAKWEKERCPNCGTEFRTLCRECYSDFASTWVHFRFKLDGIPEVQDPLEVNPGMIWCDENCFIEWANSNLEEALKILAPYILPPDRELAQMREAAQRTLKAANKWAKNHVNFNIEEVFESLNNRIMLEENARREQKLREVRDSIEDYIKRLHVTQEEYNFRLACEKHNLSPLQTEIMRFAYLRKTRGFTRDEIIQYISRRLGGVNYDILKNGLTVLSKNGYLQIQYTGYEDYLVFITPVAIQALASGQPDLP